MFLKGLMCDVEASVFGVTTQQSAYGHCKENTIQVNSVSFSAI